MFLIKLTETDHEEQALFVEYKENMVVDKHIFVWIYYLEQH